MSKKFISILLSVVMIFSGFAAFATDDEHDYGRVLEYKIMQGDENGNLNLSSLVTRAEMAQLIANILKIGDIEFPTGIADDFTDVPKEHWAYNAIMHAKAQNIVCGNGDGTFLPDNHVTYAEAIKMIVITLGYNPLAEARGAWPAGYLTVANSLGLLSITIADEYATREDVAIMLERALDIPIMAQIGFGSQVEYSILNGENGTALRTLESEFK